MKTDPDDICLWADGTWCYRHELGEYSYMSDDYEVRHQGSPEWHSFLHAQDA